MDKNLVVSKNDVSVYMPVVTVAQAQEIRKQWDDLKGSCLRDTDFHTENRKGKQVKYIKKSGWRYFATFFGLAVEAISNTEAVRTFKKNGKDVLVCSISYRATSPNGRYSDGDGHCGNDEAGKDWWTIANLLATAHTRAYNRAVSNLVGGGEVSAEEMALEAETEIDYPRAQQNHRAVIVNAQASATPVEAETVDGALDDELQAALNATTAKGSKYADLTIDQLLELASKTQDQEKLKRVELVIQCKRHERLKSLNVDQLVQVADDVSQSLEVRKEARRLIGEKTK